MAKTSKPPSDLISRVSQKSGGRRQRRPSGASAKSPVYVGDDAKVTQTSGGRSQRSPSRNGADAVTNIQEV